MKRKLENLQKKKKNKPIFTPLRNSVERKIYMKTEKIVPGARFMADTNITESPQLLLSINTVESFVWVGHQLG